MDPNILDPSKLFSVKNLVVVITGGGTGIGLMMTKAFATNGAAKIYIIGRRKEKLEEAAAPFPNVIPIVGDVSSKESLKTVAEQVRRETGYVNLLCCNSGTMPPAIGVKSRDVGVEEFAQRVWEQRDPDAFATNTTGVAFTAFAFLTLLDAGNRRISAHPIPKSQILITTSIAGYLRNPDTFGAYPLTKAAATHLVKCLSGTLVPYSIRVNGIAPGLFPSDLAAGIIAAGGNSGGDPSVEGAFSKGFIPAERLGSLSDMAGAVMFMASAAGAYLNGNVMVIDGGRIAQLPGTY